MNKDPDLIHISSDSITANDPGLHITANDPGLQSRILAICYAVFAIFHIYTAFTGPLHPLMQRGLFICGAMTLAYWEMAISTNRKSATSILFVLFSLASFYVGQHVMVNGHLYMDIMHDLTGRDLAAATLAILLLLLATQRILGWALPVLTGLALIYYFYGYKLVSGLWQPPRVSTETALSMLYASTSGIFGFMADIGTSVIAVYVIFGALLMATGAGEVFVQVANRVAGRGAGGAGKVTVVTSALFGTVSGSAVANVMAVGSVTIPTMRRAGYSKAFAAGVEASASAGGQILPPIMGAGAFLMAELLNIPYIDVAKAATLPALLYFSLIFIAIHLYSKKYNLARSAMTKTPLDAEKSIPLIGSITVLIYLLVNNYTPTFAGATATLALLVLTIATRLGAALRSKEPNALVPVIVDTASKISGGLISGGKGLIMISVLLGCAGMLTAILGASGLGVKVSGQLINLSGNHVLLALIMSALLCIMLGMDVPTTASYILTASVAAPVLIQFDLPPLTVHLFIFYFAILSAITPPVCASVYAAATIARESFWKVAKNAMLIAGGVYFLPFMMVYRPALLLDGSAGQVVYASIMTYLALFCFASATIGFLVTRASRLVRFMLVINALLYFAPGSMYDAAACGMLLLLVVIQIKKRKHGMTQPLVYTNIIEGSDND